MPRAPPQPSGRERFESLFDKLERLKARKPGDRRPMVAGTDASQRFVGIMRQCMLAHVARRRF
jgi:hypothetical protein